MLVCITVVIVAVIVCLLYVKMDLHVCLLACLACYLELVCIFTIRHALHDVPHVCWIVGTIILLAAASLHQSFH